jgi:hypothetical protein
MGARFSTFVRTGPGAYPASCAKDTGSFPGIEWPGRVRNHSPPSSGEVKERVELYLYSQSGSSWPVLGESLLFVRLFSNMYTCCSLFVKTQGQQLGLKFVKKYFSYCMMLGGSCMRQAGMCGLLCTILCTAQG